MENSLFKYEIINSIKSMFFNEALCHGVTKESIQENGMKRTESFIEWCSINGKNTICVHIIANKGDFYKCIFIDTDAASQTIWNAVMLYSTCTLPSLAIKVLSFGLPLRVQGQLMIQSLATHRAVAMPLTVFVVLYYQWRLLMESYPEIVNEGHLGAQGNTKEQIEQLTKALNDTEDETKDKSKSIEDQGSLAGNTDNSGDKLDFSSHNTAVEHLIEQLTGNKSFLDTEQLAILKNVKYKGKYILTDNGEKNILLHQASIPEYTIPEGDIPSNTQDILDNEVKTFDALSEFNSELRKLQVSPISSEQFQESLKRAASLKDELLKQDSQSFLLSDFQEKNEKNGNLYDQITQFYDESPSLNSQAVKPYTELNKLVEDLNKDLGKDFSLDNSSSDIIIPSISEPKNNSTFFQWLEYLAENYHIPSSIGFLLLLSSFIYTLYKQTYLLLTYVLPEWKKKNPEFFKKHKKLDNFVFKLTENPEKLHFLRISLSFASLYLASINFIFLAFILKFFAQLLKKIS